MSKLLAFLAFFLSLDAIASQCITPKMYEFIRQGLHPQLAYYQAVDDCRHEPEVVPPAQSNKSSEPNFSTCYKEEFRKLMWKGTQPQEAHMRATYACIRPQSEPDPRPTATNYLYTTFMGVGIVRDYAIPRAYEIVYAPGGKGPKTKEEVVAKIQSMVEVGQSYYQAVWDLYHSN